MNAERLRYVLERFGKNECSDAEAAELNDWFHAYNPGRDNMDNWLQDAGGKRKLSKELYKDFIRRTNAPARVVKIYRLYKISAAIVILAIAISFLISRENSTSLETVALNKSGGPGTEQNKSLIKPGGNKATLKLADGTVVVLSDSSNVHIAVQSNTEIKQIEKGTIAYNQMSEPDSSKQIVYNTLTTPRGGKYVVTLADGTEVTLDAESSITYPVVFKRPERRVQVTGQTYFQVVHKAKQPFRVSVRGLTIEDVGTAFNVNAHNDEPSVKITLTEGRADVHNLSKTVSLSPGQQAQIKENQENIFVKRANIEETIAWKKGWFMFHNESLQSVMKQASRWYDVDVQYEGEIPANHFGGNISKYKEISELLQNLKITGGIKYKIEGRRVIISN